MFIFHVYDVTVTSGGGGDGGDVITTNNSQSERAYSGYYQRQLRTINLLFIHSFKWHKNRAYMYFYSH